MPDTVFGEIAKKCEALWPTGPPKHWDLWYRDPVFGNSAYVEVMTSLFGKTISNTIAIRWYGVQFSNLRYTYFHPERPTSG